jgi:hypothetical protein
MLTLIKLIHTIIWTLMAAATFYILYAGLTGAFGTILWIAVILMLVEVAVLAANRMACPLTPLAGKYTNDRQPNFDIYLPLWLARYNKWIFGPLLALGILIVVLRLFI